QRGDTDGDVQDEDPAPRRLDKQSTERRPSSCAQRTAYSPNLDGVLAAFGRNGGQYQPEACRHQRRSSDCLQAAHSDDDPKVTAQRTSQAAKCENREPEQKRLFDPVTIGQSASRDE